MPSIQFRRYQRGSVYKKGTRIKNWYGMWREDVKMPDGSIERRQRKVCLGPVSELPNKSSAYDKLAECMNAASKIPSRMAFGNLTAMWESAVVPTLKSTTANYYLKILRAHVLPAFGTWEAGTISRYDVECFLASAAKHYARNTLRGLRVSLSQVLTWGVSCGYLPKNVCAGVKLPLAHKSVVRTILSSDQVAAIADRLKEPYSSLVLFQAITGLRIGEAIGTKWTDFDGDVLQIRRRIYEGRVDTTKTAGSNRSIPIPEALLSRMRTLGDGDWIFRSRESTPINPGNALKRYVRPAAQELGIHLGGWHDFRHTLTTGLMRSHVSPKVVSSLLGHSNVKITLDTYTHSNVEDLRLPLAEVARHLLPVVTNSVQPPTDSVAM